MIDETHTFSAGPGRRHRAPGGCEPDIFVDRQGDRRRHPVRRLRASPRRSPTRCAAATRDADIVDVGGVGGTLAGNALSMAAMRATLERGPHRRGVRADDRAGDRASPPASQATIDAHGAAVVGEPARGPRRVPVRRPGAAHRRRVGRGAADEELDEYLHLYLRQPRRPDDAVPQHGADVPGHVRGGRRPAHAGCSRRRSRSW